MSSPSVAGGTSDIGVGAGFFAALTRNRAGYTPYAWNIEAAGFISFLVVDKALVLPYTDVYSKLTVDRLLGGPLQLDIRPSFTNELTLNYYGMGNASSATPPAGMTSKYFESFPARTPRCFSMFAYEILNHFAGRVGLRYIESFFDIPADVEAGGRHPQRVPGGEVAHRPNPRRRGQPSSVMACSSTTATTRRRPTRDCSMRSRST